MTKTLREFFPDNIHTREEEEKRISNRFPAFRARAIDEEQAASIRRSSTKTEWVKGIPVKEIDGEANMLSLIIASVTFPDLRNAELQEAWGTVGAEALLKKMLLPGEYAALSDWITQLNGFDQTLQELVDEAKN